MQPRYWLSASSLIGALTTWLLINSTEIWQFSVLFAIDVTVVTSAGLVLSKILSDLSKDRRGSVFGLQGLISNFGALCGPLVGGVLWELSGDRAPFHLSIVVEAVLALAYLIILSFFFFHDQREKKRSTNHANV